ncbi:MAG: cation:proton antiporter [Theionarchaea archaeon]|nr:cation:proton antiporter [Theionarchaea archaeon]
MAMSIIVKTTTRFLAALMLLFGVYIIFTGHINPGGGFQGGVILASVVLLLFIAFGQKYPHIPENLASFLEDISALSLVLLGIICLIIGKAVFSNFILGTKYDFFSAGTIPYINCIIGLEVGAAFMVLFYTFFTFMRRQS